MIDKEIKFLAAVAYGEAGKKNDIKESGGIAYAVMNRLRAYNKYLVSKGKEAMTVMQLFKIDPKYAFAANGKNDRFNLFMKAKDEEIRAHPVMSKVLNAAIDAMNETGIDYSNGAFWWDGIDIKTEYNTHAKVEKGIQFTDPSHNIFNIKESRIEKIAYLYHYNKKTKKTTRTVKGKYYYVYSSVAAHGDTIFWKTNEDYVKLAGAKPFR